MPYLIPTAQTARELAHESRMARLIPSDGAGVKSPYPAFPTPRYRVEECPQFFIREENQRIRLGRDGFPEQVADEFSEEDAR